MLAESLFDHVRGWRGCTGFLFQRKKSIASVRWRLRFFNRFSNNVHYLNSCSIPYKVGWYLITKFEIYVDYKKNYVIRQVVDPYF